MNSENLLNKKLKIENNTPNYKKIQKAFLLKEENLLLFNSNINEDEIRLLSNLLKFNQSLKKLNLGNNNLNDNLIQILCEGLKYNSYLLDLSLYRNLIKNKGCEYICDVLKFNKNIKFLNLSRNKFDYKGFDIIGNMLKYNNTIENLNLYYNKIEYPYKEKLPTEETPTLDFYDNISQNNTLKILDLSYTNITVSLINLGHCLTKNTSLKKIDLGYNNFFPHDFSYFYNCLEKNHRIENIIFNSNVNSNNEFHKKVLHLLTEKKQKKIKILILLLIERKKTLNSYFYENFLPFDMFKLILQLSMLI